MPNREHVGRFYLALGVVIVVATVYLKLCDVLVTFVLSLITSFTLWWCVGWSFIGIGTGLINTRNHPKPPHWFLHYVGYYLFVLVVVSLASFVTPFWLFQHTWNDMSPETLSLRALVALVGGFEGWRLSEHTRRAGGGG